MNKLQRHEANKAYMDAGPHYGETVTVCYADDVSALEAENERLRAAMTAKIEPWIECAVWEIDSRCLETGAFFNRNQAANIIAAHAPKQEPSVPVSKLKTWRNAASIPLTYSDAVAFDELIHQAAQPTEKEDD